MVDLASLTEKNHPALFYQEMIGDELRMKRYRQAIEQAVRPGDVVADLGTGLGILAMMAAQAGAKRVYAIDQRAQSLWVADRVIRANGLAERVRLIEGNVREVRLEEPVDLIVNELIGNFGINEGIFESVRDFAGKNLKPGGRILPERMRTHLIPVEYRREFRGIWRRNNAGLDLRAAMDLPFKPEFVRFALRHRPKELAEALLVEDIAFGPDLGERPKRIDHRFEVVRRGLLQGFVGSFEATLIDGIALTNYPRYTGCHWENWNWPVNPPPAVEPGQAIALRLDADSDVRASWSLDWTLEPG